ncbi:hypothetical protein H0B56_04570 [Haloechinothrix sp. YIM 98757]|uniref:Uncharacterized protein n=1 Tax=Haloechinothrix aidingensis TaxID=2752311 RepID=A0A838A8L1_9PSEU|nr:hypothetical protein [Haloechinothrix aidingensis]MBA0124809.1 hypothetical protein [Haloechinothrix aidingensis]
MTHDSNDPEDQPTLPGRHRRSGGSKTWTPTVPKRKSGARHRVPDGPEDSTAAAGMATSTVPRARTSTSMSGSLAPPPVAFPAPTGDTSPWRPPEQPGRENIAGTLPTDTSSGGAALPPDPPGTPVEPADTPVEPPERDRGDLATAGADPDVPPLAPPERVGVDDQRPARTRVTLIPQDEPEDDARVYAAPPPDGLGKFDLGTVPASVTPPRSWRKAAWFATMSSGGVVVALLVAGSHLVSQPTDQLADDGWPGLRGDQPELHHDGLPGPTDEPGDDTTTTEGGPTTTDPERISDLAGVRTPETTNSASAGTGGSGPSQGGQDTGSAPPTTTQPPQKPSPSPAPRETRRAPLYSFPPDAETMGDRSEIFLNEITENPERAHEQTGGELHEEGADGIAERYSHIAYFEIEHIHIDQRKRMTVNTVKVVYNDGSSTQEQRTLRFEEGDKITSD